MNLSSREKILIFVLLTVLSVFLLYRYFYMPVKAEYETNKMTYQDLTMQKKLRQTQAQQYGDLDKAISEAEDAAADAAQPFFPSLEAENLNLWLNKAVLQAGLKVQNLSVSDPVTATVGETLPASAENSYPIREYAEAFLGTRDGEAPAASQTQDAANQEETNDTVLSASVSLTVTGSVPAMEAFCSGIKNSGKTVLIRSIAYLYASDEDREAGLATISAELVFYSVPKASDNVFE